MILALMIWACIMSAYAGYHNGRRIEMQQWAAACKAKLRPEDEMAVLSLVKEMQGDWPEDE